MLCIHRWVLQQMTGNIKKLCIKGWNINFYMKKTSGYGFVCLKKATQRLLGILYIQLAGVWLRVRATRLRITRLDITERIRCDSVWRIFFPSAGKNYRAKAVPTICTQKCIENPDISLTEVYIYNSWSCFRWFLFFLFFCHIQPLALGKMCSLFFVGCVCSLFFVGGGSNHGGITKQDFDKCSMVVPVKNSSINHKAADQIYPLIAVREPVISKRIFAVCSEHIQFPNLYIYI